MVHGVGPPSGLGWPVGSHCPCQMDPVFGRESAQAQGERETAVANPGLSSVGRGASRPAQKTKHARLATKLWVTLFPQMRLVEDIAPSRCQEFMNVSLARKVGSQDGPRMGILGTCQSARNKIHRLPRGLFMSRESLA